MIIIGVMGAGEGATNRDIEHEGWFVLTGGRDAGVMAAVRGAKRVDGSVTSAFSRASQGRPRPISTFRSTPASATRVMRSTFFPAVW